MVDTELTGMGRDQPAPAASPPPAPPPPHPSPPPPPPLPDEAEALDIAVAVKKKRRPYRHKKFGCTVAEQIMKAVAVTKQRRRMRVAAMKRMLSASGCKLGRNDSRLNRAVRSLVTKGSLVQTAKAVTAAGSVRLSQQLKMAGAKKQEAPPAAGKKASKRTVAVKRSAKKPKRPSAGREQRKVLQKTGRRGRSPTVFRRAAKWRVERMRRAARRPTETKVTKTPSTSVNSNDIAVQKTGSFQSH